TVPLGTNPPVGVTWNVGITENWSPARMQGLYASLVAANNGIWNISEGQVRIHRIRIYDAVAPGLSASQFVFGGGGANTSNLDVLVWPTTTWDVPMTGAVTVTGGHGRSGRFMVVPENASTFIFMHEASHFLFRLSWNVGPVLGDEYQDGVQDIACVMESERAPSRWCSDTNHSGQNSQPHACWRQILSDYPSFRHAGRDTATALPPAPIAEYFDVP
ncbi:MAG: hypothetical protein ACHQ1G_05590, partial [Planctomycetota bacterium]